MHRHRPFSISVPAAALVLLISGAAHAADVPHRGAAPPLSAGRRDALDHLERAEIALLNRHVYDLGPQLRTDRPVPPTSAISDLDRARLAVLTADARHARRAVTAAHRIIGVELGAVPKAAPRGSSAQAGKETTP
jgi:hypothetical protein